jgi:polycomb protein SUZ12
VFSKGPTLKFRLSWTTEPSNGLVDRPKPLRPQDHSLDSSSNKENRPGKLATSTVQISCKEGEENVKLSLCIY